MILVLAIFLFILFSRITTDDGFIEVGLTALLSGEIFMDFAHLWIYTRKLKELEKKALSMFPANVCDDGWKANLYLLVTDYEAIIGACSLILDSRIYDKLNAELTTKWKTLSETEFINVLKT